MRRVLVVLGATLALGGLPGGASAEDRLGGFVLDAGSAGVSIYYDQPSLGVPASPTAELSVARSVARLTSGPIGYSLSSVVYPGDVAANAGNFVAGEIRRQSGRDDFPDPPPYPLRAESFHPQGPETAAAEPTPGMSMRSRAVEDATESATSTAGTNLPGILETGLVRSTARSAVRATAATAGATSGVTGVSILGGLVTIDGVSSVGTATSDGRVAKLGGTVRVAGLRIAGMQAVVDERGVQAADREAPGAASAVQVLRQTLQEAGVTLLVAGPIDTVQGPTGTRSVGGLLVRFEAGVLKPFVARLPDDLRRQVEGTFGLDQSVTVVLGALIVSSGATPAPPFEAGDVAGREPASQIGRAPAEGVDVLGNAEPAGPAPAPGRRQARARPGARAPLSPLDVRPAAGSFAGIPLSLVGIATIAAAAIADLGRRIADRAFSPAPAAGCPLED